jgi:hypothetical protein
MTAVVEVVSPSARKFDGKTKLTGYFSLPSVQHYLIVGPGARRWFTTIARPMDQSGDRLQARAR